MFTTNILLLTVSLSALLSAQEKLDLPDPLLSLDGEKITSSVMWEQSRRTEILELFRENVYGRAPVQRPADLAFEVVDSDTNAMDGIATRKLVDISFAGPGGEGKIRLALFIPNAAAKPVPAFLLICHRDNEYMDVERKIKDPFWPAERIVERGYAAAVFNTADVDPDNYDKWRNGVHKIFREPGQKHAPNAWGTISAWGWGASRCMDYFETDNDIDDAHVAVLGHSRGGKAALWCGAEDERFALVISNNSGCTGAAIARRKSGERVKQINDVFPHWFCENYTKYNDKEDEMPVDQHMLLSLIAPRLVYAASASKDDWADPMGEFLAAVHAGPVYNLYGLKGLETDQMPQADKPIHTGSIAYHMRTGRHSLTQYDWDIYMDYADEKWFAKEKFQLRKGSAPKPVSTPHFPDALHAFIWRNWNLVPVERMAWTVEAKPEQILEIGKTMGLPEPGPVSEDQWARSYITIIRRNWHLLPYEQLLKLLDWTPEKMAFVLREDDFLFIKLGRLKPDSPMVIYSPSAHKEAEKDEKQIAKYIKKLKFPAEREPLFSFVGNLSAPFDNERCATPESRFSPRFCSSYFATYGDPLLKDEPDPYPDGYLARLAASGVDGVWMQGVLYKLAPFPWDPELSAKYEERLERLAELVARAKKHGIGVYLYLNEPRAMPLAFYDEREDLKGVVEGEYAAMCVSTPEVREYLRKSVALICKNVPDLAGFFTISASENLTNCWSHRKGAECPRCSKRPPADVLSDVTASIHQGIKDANAKTRLIAWDWQWRDDWIEGILDQMPKDVSLMSVSEWSIPIERGGVKTAVGEYSISVVGPGPRATKHWAMAQERGIQTLAKIQAGNTWELASVPYIPAVANVAQHAANLRDKKLDGIMLGWTLGGHPSPNLEVVAELGGLEDITVDEALMRVASRRFGEKSAPAVVTVWKEVSEAFSEFPYNGGTLYNAPQQMGPANLLYPEPTGYASTMVGIPYDALKRWRAVYPAEIFIQQMEKVADGFEKGYEDLAKTFKSAKLEPDQEKNLAQEVRIAEACYIHYQSVANQCRFIMARDALAGQDNKKETIDELERLIKNEIKLATRLRELQLQDSRFGFEASNHYFYVPQDLAEKVLNCQYLLDKWLPEMTEK